MLQVSVRPLFARCRCIVHAVRGPLLAAASQAQPSCSLKIRALASRRQPDPTTPQQGTRQAAQTGPRQRQPAQPPETRGPGQAGSASTGQQRQLELQRQQWLGQEQQRQQQPLHRQELQARRQQLPQQQQLNAQRQQQGVGQGARTRGQLPQGRPQLQLAVIVEGHNDRIAVQRAVGAQVYVLGGSTRTQSHFSDRLLRELQELRDKHGGLVILTDSDVAGRQARNWMETKIPGCFHAFVPAPLATSVVDTEWHAAGNVGVEHAPPLVVRQALRRMRQGNAARTEFSREGLVQLGLVAPSHLFKGGNFATRRALVCAYLGIGNCDGKQLLRQLNVYGFTREDLMAAMAWAKGQLQQQGSAEAWEAGGPGLTEPQQQQLLQQCEAQEPAQHEWQRQQGVGRSGGGGGEGNGMPH